MKRLPALFLLLLANSAYLAAWAEASLFYFANVAFHLVLGVALAVLAARAFPGWRRAPRTLALAAPVLGIAAVAGIALAVVGATRANAWLLRLHIATAVIGSVLVLGWMFATVVRRARPGETAGTAVGLSVLGAILLATGILVVKDRREAPQRYRIANPALPPETMEGEGAGPKAPFFPSSAQTNVGGTIPSNFFMTSQTCARCHEEIYEQWTLVRPPLLVLQQPVVPQVDRVHAGRRGHPAVEVVRGLPRPRRLLQRALRPADQGADRHAGGAGRA